MLLMSVFARFKKAFNQLILMNAKICICMLNKNGEVMITLERRRKIINLLF